jgi:hypothetical protein
MRKQVFLQFGVIIALGLALAGWYVGYRVVTARAAQPLEPGSGMVVHTPVPHRQPTPPPAESKPAEIPAPVAPVTKPVAVAPAPTAPVVSASEIAKPVIAAQPAKRSDAPAQALSAKPVGPAPVEVARVAAPEIAKAVKAAQPARRSDAPAQPLSAKPVGPAPEIAKPLKAPQQAKRSDAPAQPLRAIAPVVAARTFAAVPETAKPVKAPQQAKRSDTPVQPFRRHEATPRTGEKYLQIAAFGPRALDGYLKTLEGQGLHPLVAPGPVDSIYRILVGPFASAEALEQTRHSIQASGIEPILRAY